MAVFATTQVAGIDNVAVDATEAVSVIGRAGRIDIVGDYDKAEVYTIEGRRTGLTGLAAGIYLVRIDGRTHKVTVR